MRTEEDLSAIVSQLNATLDKIDLLLEQDERAALLVGSVRDLTGEIRAQLDALTVALTALREHPSGE